MAKPEFIARQSAHPNGLIGHIVARVMALDTAAVNRRAVGRLDPKPGERILELGCGHGRTLRRVAGRVGHGFAAGVDPSQVMLAVARRHLRRDIAAGRARVDEGDAARIPHADAGFDKAFSVHTIYFWPHLDAGLRELHRVLRPGGELLLVFRDGRDGATAAELPASVYTLRSAKEVEDALGAAGFRAVASEIDDGDVFARAHR
jgi:ubiquinone/menaquinone biosynthesis C-methylase UbiE